MGIIVPRPAMRKREESNVRFNLEAHARRMKELIAEGMDVTAASKQALQDVLHPSLRFEDEAKAAIAAGTKETDFVNASYVEFQPARRKAYRKVKKELANAVTGRVTA